MNNENKAHLTFGDGGSQQIPLEDFTLLGRDSACHIPLFGDQIAERHARIEKRESQFVIRDLRSPTGTFVNGLQVQEAPLKENDIIRLGNKELTFSIGPTEPVDEFPLRSRNPLWDTQLRSLVHVSKTDLPVLLLGPSGTGKDVLAKGMHQKSVRKNGPFVSVNCSALTESLVESELFGHVKGSFTGAIGDRKGAFETARGGTLFLDEVGDLPYGLQAKILRAIENNEIRPVGSDRTVLTDIRIIAATHQNLAEKIRDREFRSDLYFRLNVVTIHTPALTERMEDFEDLLFTFARQLKVRFSLVAINRLKSHTWPGNIRELRNVVARASAFFPQQLIEDSHIERLIEKSPAETAVPQVPPSQSLPVIKEIERQMIVKRLIANQGNQRKTAADLGMPKSTLHDRLKFYKIDISAFRV